MDLRAGFGGPLGGMTLDDKHSRPGRDLQLALDTAESLQATIRHADAKAQILLAAQGGTAALVAQQVSTFGDLDNAAVLALGGIMMVTWLAGLTVGGCHLLMAIIPRLSRPGGTGNALLDRRPDTDDHGDPRASAWDLVSILTAIASAKHTHVRKAVPAIILASASAGSLLAMSAAVAMTT
jgi:hypothetical protein